MRLLLVMLLLTAGCEKDSGSTMPTPETEQAGLVLPQCSDDFPAEARTTEEWGGAKTSVLPMHWDHERHAWRPLRLPRPPHNHAIDIEKIWHLPDLSRYQADNRNRVYLEVQVVSETVYAPTHSDPIRPELLSSYTLAALRACIKQTASQ